MNNVFWTKHNVQDSHRKLSPPLYFVSFLPLVLQFCATKHHICLLDVLPQSGSLYGRGFTSTCTLYTFVQYCIICLRFCPLHFILYGFLFLLPTFVWCATLHHIFLHLTFCATLHYLPPLCACHFAIWTIFSAFPSFCTWILAPDFCAKLHHIFFALDFCATLHHIFFAPDFCATAQHYLSLLSACGCCGLPLPVSSLHST